MLKKLDHDFFEMLDDPAKVEKRLTELASQRMHFVISAVISALGFFFVLFIMLSAMVRYPSLSNQPSIAGPVSGCMCMVVGMATTLARAIGAHSEIRSLLTFKKLRDLHAND